jgi:antitoxin YobK
MSIEKYQEALKIIQATGLGDFEGPKPETLVTSAEATLGVTFPPSYRRFLLDLGCGSFKGFEVYGLIDDRFENSSVPNGIWLTLSERCTGLDPAYVLIGEGGDGTLLGLDTGRLANSGEAPVVRLSVNGNEAEPVAASFGEYFLEAIQRLA